MKFEQIELISFQGDKFSPSQRNFDHIDNFIGSIDNIKNKLSNLHIMKPVEHVIHDLGLTLDSILKNRNSKIGMTRSLDMGKAKMGLLNAMDDESTINIIPTSKAKKSLGMKMQYKK